MYQPNQIYSFIARGRFSSGGFDPGLGHDVSAFTPQRLEFEARANFGSVPRPVPISQSRRSGRSMSGRLLYREHEQQGAIVMLLAMAGWQEWTAAGIVAAIFATVALREYWGE
jgi:hypothetical protein